MKKKRSGKFKDLANRKGTKNLFFVLFFFFFIGGYLLFFTSRYWMQTSGGAKRLSPLNQEIDWNDRKVRLLRWEYSPDQKLMEVELAITNTAFDGMDKYQYSAWESRKGELNVKPVLEDSDWAVVQIRDVPERFGEISFRMEMPEDENAGMIRMYTNINDVEYTDRIDTKDKKGYQKQRFQTEITAYETEIEDLKKEIRKSEKQIGTITKEIEDMEAKKEYQTDEQKENTDKLISEALEKIDTLKETIAGTYADIEEQEERITNIKQQLEKLG